MQLSGIDISQFDDNFKPQDSLYDYVNNNWLSKTEIPDDQIGWGSYMTLREESLKNQYDLIEDLMKDQKNLSSSSEEGKILNLYLSYMNRELLNELGSSPLKKDINEIKNLKSIDDIWKYFALSVRKGLGAPLYFAVYDDL